MTIRNKQFQSYHHEASQLKQKGISNKVTFSFLENAISHYIFIVRSTYPFLVVANATVAINIVAMAMPIEMLNILFYYVVLTINIYRDVLFFVKAIDKSVLPFFEFHNGWENQSYNINIRHNPIYQ